MEAELGLRERKKRETRQRIADMAMGLFMARGFENVTVAEVARVADVSANTVFNYFKTKEDLFLDRQDVYVDEPSRVVRERRAGESVIAALRRDFLEALEEGDWRSGLNEGADVVIRLINESPSLMARMRELAERREERLAETLAEATGADEDDIRPGLVAAQVCAAIRRLTADGIRRKLAGESHDHVVRDIRAQAGLAFDLLENGIGAYGGA
ncbi:TetR/AcrR family transcriptional regulator [Sphaerisporangium perillae]|uniref:TetR/AcrR family transcriptional regulator n=1 Tax=Sphaerisporangium perillae TaxID=2935860 RepID=UPI00200CA1B1|nr:TetR/AcrR family transcriptional regulator [Sphaerisporangium perillae]